MDCSPPGSSVHGILPVKILEWVAMLFSREFSQPREGSWSPALLKDSFYMTKGREANSNSICLNSESELSILYLIYCLIPNNITHCISLLLLQQQAITNLVDQSNTNSLFYSLKVLSLKWVYRIKIKG